MNESVWRRLSSWGLHLPEGHFGTGKSACATRFSRARLVLRCFGLLLFVGPAHAGSHLLGIKVSVTNPSGEERRSEPVVIPISALRKIAPDLRAGSLIVSISHSSDLQQDAVALQATEIPSQVDDLDDDGKADELVFQLDLKPHETCVVTITYGQ